MKRAEWAFALLAPVLFGLTLVALGVYKSFAEPVAPRIPPSFVPFNVFYMNGALMNVKPLTEKNEQGEDKLIVFADLDECMQKMRHAVEHLMTTGAVPAGGGLVGMCVPMASVDPTIRGTAN